MSALIPVLGLVAGALLMAVSNMTDTNWLFWVSNLMLVVFSLLYFKK